MQLEDYTEAHPDFLNAFEFLAIQLASLLDDFTYLAFSFQDIDFSVFASEVHALAKTVPEEDILAAGWMGQRLVLQLENDISTVGDSSRDLVNALESRTSFYQTPELPNHVAFCVAIMMKGYLGAYDFSHSMFEKLIVAASPDPEKFSIEAVKQQKLTLLSTDFEHHVAWFNATVVPYSYYAIYYGNFFQTFGAGITTGLMDSDSSLGGSTTDHTVSVSE